jgi:hypothetical protein
MLVPWKLDLRPEHQTYGPSLTRSSSLAITLAAGFILHLAPAVTSKENNILDAQVCAQIAHSFAARRDWLEALHPDALVSESWIWAPLPLFLRK